MSYRKLVSLCVLAVVLLTVIPMQAFAMDDGSMYAVVDGSPVDMWGDTLLFTLPVRTASGTRTDLYAESLSRGTRECLGPVAGGQAAVFVDWVAFAKPTASGTRIILRSLIGREETRDLGYGADPQFDFYAGDRAVVFTSSRPGSDGTDVWGYRMESRLTTILAGGPGEQTQPWLDANFLGFVQDGRGVRVKNLESGVESTVTTRAEAKEPLVTRYGWAAWLDTELLGTQESPAGWFRRLPDGEPRELEALAGDPVFLTGNADYACWTSTYGDRSYVKARKVATDTALYPIDFGAANGLGYAQSPAISGNSIAWRQVFPPGDRRPATLQMASLLYSLSLTPSTTAPRAGAAVTLGGRMNRKDRTAAANMRVAIEKWTGSRWSGVAVGTTSSYGRFVCTVRPTVKTTYRFRYITLGAEPPVFSEKVTIYPR